MKSRLARATYSSLFFLGIMLIVHSPAYSSVLYVKAAPEGDDSNNGLSWSSAKATVKGAIAVASSGDEVWVKAGTYYEQVGNRIAKTGALDVALYGGFKGTETRREQRNWRRNATVLHGDGNGAVVTISGGAGSKTCVDGFQITHGSGGIVISNSAPIIANNTIKGNTGPGISIAKYQIIQIDPGIVKHPLVTRNTIVDNVSINGGGIVVVGDLLTNIVPPPPSSPKITDNFIARNRASLNGGGIGCWGHTAPFIANNCIYANSANNYEPGWDGDDPEGIWSVGGGGIFATSRDFDGAPVEYAISAPTIVNNVLAVNGALLGGGICLVNYKQLSREKNPPPVVTNNTIVANNGSGVYSGDTFPTIRNNLVAFNTWGFEQDRQSNADIGYNNIFCNMVHGQESNYKGISDQTGKNGNISADPKLVNYKYGQFHLQPDSPCINAGLLSAVDNRWKDIDGQARVLGRGVDIGADESDGVSRSFTVPVIHVSPTGKDTRDGLTWATAKKTVAHGISTAAQTGGDVWVASGTYFEHVSIPPFVYLYGGFAGNEKSLAQRNTDANPTILDGGGIPTIVLSSNAGYLVSALNGFTVQNGGVYQGDEVPGAHDGVEGRGGGIRAAVSSLYIANNVIQRCSFGNPFDNANKRGNGAGIHGYLSHSIIQGNTVTENEILNTFDGSGAGMYFKLCMATIEGNRIHRNHAKYGSAIFSTISIIQINKNVIENNAMYNTYPLPLYLGSAQGAITIEMGEDFLIEGNVIRENVAGTGAGIYVAANLAGRIQNNLIANNKAYDPTAFGGTGGGIHCNVLPEAVNKLHIVNNTIVGNTATYEGLGTEQGGGISAALPYVLSTSASNLDIANNIIAFNSSGIFLPPVSLAPYLYNNDVFNVGADYINLNAGSKDFSKDPLFVDQDGADEDPAATADNDYHLKPYSPCIDAGVNRASRLPATDLNGQTRIVDGDNNGSVIVDTGAYEYSYRRSSLKADYNGDGKADVLLRNVTGDTWVWLMNGTALCSDSHPGTLPSGWEIAGAGDFDGDGKSDLLWQHLTKGRVSVWLMDGAAKRTSSTHGASGVDWSVRGVYDFDGDGKSDILFHNKRTGKVRVWLMNGTSLISSGILEGEALDWEIAGLSDLDGDGKSDVLWENRTLGKVKVWLLDGKVTKASRTYNASGLDWFVAGIGDFDRDGRNDILWRNRSTGRVQVWLMNGVGSPSKGTPGRMALTWEIAALCDLDGDKKEDVLWQDRRHGRVRVWLLNGLQKNDSRNLATPGLDWLVASTGDFNGDKNSDILWQDTAKGRLRVWLMNGKTRSSTGTPAPAGLTWEIQ